MAKLVRLKHRETGMETQGIYGFSWTIVFFGALPMVFRGDYQTFLGVFPTVLLVLFSVCWGAGFLCTVFVALAIRVILASKYNKYYTAGLLERGYQLAGIPAKNTEAAKALDLGAAQAYFFEASTRKCPFCAEPVKAEAIVCRFCQRDLPRLEAAETEPSEPTDGIDRNKAHAHEQKQLLDRLGVEQKDGLFFYQGKGYPNLSDIPFGKKGG